LVLPGEPTSAPSAAVNAPFTPATLKAAMDGKGGVRLPRPAALSNVNPVVDAPKLTPVRRLAAAAKSTTASPPVLRPTPEPLYMPMADPAGTWPPNQAVWKASRVDAAVVSTKMTDWPGAIVLIPASGTEFVNEFELSSILQPAREIG